MAADVRELREWRSTSQGRGAVIAVVTSAAVGLVVSIVVGLVLYVATRGG
jgi:hypothetical protein